MEGEWGFGIEGIPEHGSGRRHRAALPPAAEESAGRKPMKEEFQAADLLWRVHSRCEFHPIGARRGGDPGAARMLSLPARRRQPAALDGGATTVAGHRCALRVESVRVLEGDDLEPDAPAVEVEDGIAKVEAELVHCGLSLARRVNGNSTGPGGSSARGGRATLCEVRAPDPAVPHAVVRSPPLAAPL